MNKNKLLIILILRILLCTLFVFSGISKLYPIFAFEKQLVDLGFASWCNNVSYLSRGLIAVEIFLGLSFLQSHFLKRFVIPATFIVLVIFCVHLTIEIFTKGANSGNCGCFGQLIKMTPLEALIKNIVTLGLLGYMYSIYIEKEKNNYLVLLCLYLASNLFIFTVYPFTPCGNNLAVDESNLVLPLDNTSDTSQIVAKDTTPVTRVDITQVTPQLPVPVTTPTNPVVIKKDTARKVQPTPVNNGPAQKTSEFTSYRMFSGGVSTNLDDGKKIVTLFSLECEHCMETCKQLGELNKKKPLPGVYILFWGTEDQVDNFFKVAQCRFPYKIIPPEAFFPLLGKAPSPPRVVYLHNGNIMGDWDMNSFKIETLEQTVTK